jgi:4-alpha-glucanotransferase
VRYEASDQIFTPPDQTLRQVLGTLGHPCDDDQAALRSLLLLRRRPWVRPIDPVAVCWQGDAAASNVTVSVPAGDPTPDLTLILEDGTRRSLRDPVWGGTRTVDEGEGERQRAGGRGSHGARLRGTVSLPADLPLGYHRLTITERSQVHGCTVIVAPATCPTPGTRRRWGWMVQTYALRSAASWGQGEFRDLAELASWSATHGADFVLTNPVHAVAPTLPQQASPYSPTSRRFVNPCYLHLPDLPEYAELPAGEQHALRRLPPELAPDSQRIDRDRIWSIKRAVLQRLFEVMSSSRRAQLAAYRRERGASLERFARFCALSELHGLPFDAWPAELQDPRTPEVEQWARDHADRVALHAWLQLACDEQLASAQDRARTAGMSVGIIHDLAVGVDPAGADVWTLPEAFARNVSVGAPPDAFNQQGQNWTQPPLLPDAQRATGFRAFREVVRAALQAGGGLRVDHILGLSRLFWIPHGARPADGTYVRYPADELFAVLALEAHRAGAIVIGEDLGTIDDRIRSLMRRRGVASSAALYFEAQGEGRRPAHAYPPHALASVNTHDLPTATGFWDGSAFALRQRLGLFREPLTRERARMEDEQRSMLELLIDHGCLRKGDTAVRARVVAMHRFLAATPSLLVAGALWDAVGDTRQPNVPGTVDEYPNWRLPLARSTPAGPQPVTLEEIMRSTTVSDAVTALHRGGPTR